ncbi:MAG: chemotaxis protein CheW [Candidatus Acidulodesulfobacterium sp.]
MNNTYNLFDLKFAKASGFDIVTPWIDDLLDKKSGENDDDKKQTAQILSYPVDRILTVESEFPAINYPAENETPDIHIVSAPIADNFEKKGLDLNGTAMHKHEDFQMQAESVQPVPYFDLEKEISYFTFIAGSSFYALPALNINEIIKYKTPVNIFSKKASHLGIILYRNRMVPVYDFYLLSNGSMDIKSPLKYIVVCVYSDKFFGLAVNEIKNITAVKNKNIIAGSSFKFKNVNGITSGVFEDGEGKFYSVIDLKNVYSYLTS